MLGAINNIYVILISGHNINIQNYLKYEILVVKMPSENISFALIHNNADDGFSSLYLH